MNSATEKPIAPAFARRARRTLIYVVAVATLVYGATSDRLLNDRLRRSVIDQARLVVAALAAHADGDLSEPVDRIRGTCPGVMAIGLVDGFGNTEKVHPDRPMFRRAMAAALDALPKEDSRDSGDSAAVVIRSAVPLNEAALETVGVLIPTRSVDFRNACDVVVLFQDQSYRRVWLASMGVFLSFLSGGTFLGYRWLRHWFDRGVARPLHAIAGAFEDPLGPELCRLSLGGWRETARIADQFERLARSVQHGDSERRKLQRETERLLHDRLAGVDRQLRRAKDRATTDPLTTLRNRAYLEERLETLFEEQRARDVDLSAVMFDLDNFKIHNDTHGHQAGDALLRFIGALLRGTLRPTDVAVRYGGDEFLVILPDTPSEQASAIADRIVKLFGQYAKRLEQSKGLSMSAGVASVTGDGCRNGHDLIAKADSALYAAKRNGKNGVARYRAA